MEFFRLLFDRLAWIKHQFLSCIRDWRKARNLWGMLRRVGGVRKSIHQSWLAKGLGLGLLCWGFMGFQEEIPSEEASTLEIESVAFPLGQYTSPKLYPCPRLFDQDGHQDNSLNAVNDKTFLLLLLYFFSFKVHSLIFFLVSLSGFRYLFIYLFIPLFTILFFYHYLLIR